MEAREGRESQSSETIRLNFGADEEDKSVGAKKSERTIFEPEKRLGGQRLQESSEGKKMRGRRWRHGEKAESSGLTLDEGDAER